MSLRVADQKDFFAVIGLVEELFAVSMQNRAQFNWDTSSIRDELHKAQTLVYFEHDNLLAFLCYRETLDFFEVTVLATRAQFRKLGLQSKIFAHLQKLCAANNKSILLEVHEDNFGAIELYKRQGFLELNRRKNYYSDGKSALVFKFAPLKV